VADSAASSLIVLLPILAAMAAVVDWIGVGARRPGLEYIGKPLTMVILIAWLVIGAGVPASLSVPTSLFLAALCFSLLGDILLMLPAGRFLLGLVLFLVAHLGYIAAFTWKRARPSASEVLLAAAVGVLLALLLPRIRAGLRRSGHPTYLLPVGAYAVVLGGMLWSAVAVLLHDSWLAAGAIWVALGGASFFASDVSLVWDRFVTPLPGRRITTHILYHLAQLALTGGVLTALSE